MTAISRSKTNIYITTVGTALSALASSDIYKGDIKSYSKSGGEKDVESDPVFGGFVDKEKPVSQIELAFEIIPALDADLADRWDSMAYTAETIGSDTIYTMATEGLAATTATEAADRMVVIEAVSGTDYKTIAFNNCNVTLLDVEHNADDNRTMNMTLKFSPTDGNGVSNFMTAKLAATAMPEWSELLNN